MYSNYHALTPMIPADIASSITVAQVPIILVPWPLLPSPILAFGELPPYVQKVMAYDINLGKQREKYFVCLVVTDIDLGSFTSY